MFAWDIGYWFCCLNPREREVLRLTAEGLVLTLFVGVPVAVWDLFWITYAGNGAAVREAFLSIYKLEIVTIVVEEVPVDVVVPVGGYLADWVSWSLYVATPAAVCGDGCQQSRVP
jgi:hypothetical protein